MDSTPSQCRPRLIRGDVGYGNEKPKVQAESRDRGYLFKLKRTSTIKATF